MSLRRIIGSIASGIANRFTDSFNRANNGTELGRADDGSLWTTIRGAWQISSNTAISNTAATSYPAATISMPGTNLTVDMTISGGGNGAGALLWATDANNWWAVDVYQGVSTVCNAYTAAYNTVNGNYTYCVVPFYTSYCNAWSRGTCNGYNHAYYKNATYCQAYNFNCSGGWYAYTGCSTYGNGSYTYYSFAGYYVCSSSSTVYPKYLRVLKMVAGSVSQMASVFLGNSVYSPAVRATLVGNQITAKAYSDSFTTQLGSDLVYTATGATLTANYGIVITPSDVSQGNNVDSLTITRND
jgi:hypothetical protein